MWGSSTCWGKDGPVRDMPLSQPSEVEASVLVIDVPVRGVQRAAFLSCSTSAGGRAHTRLPPPCKGLHFAIAQPTLACMHLCVTLSCVYAYMRHPLMHRLCVYAPPSHASSMRHPLMHCLCVYASPSHASSMCLCVVTLSCLSASIRHPHMHHTSVRLWVTISCVIYASPSRASYFYASMGHHLMRRRCVNLLCVYASPSHASRVRASPPHASPVAIGVASTYGTSANNSPRPQPAAAPEPQLSLIEKARILFSSFRPVYWQVRLACLLCRRAGYVRCSSEVVAKACSKGFADSC